MDKDQLIDLLKELIEDGTIQIAIVREQGRDKLAVVVDDVWVAQDLT